MHSVEQMGSFFKEPRKKLKWPNGPPSGIYGLCFLSASDKANQIMMLLVGIADKLKLGFRLQ